MLVSLIFEFIFVDLATEVDAGFMLPMRIAACFDFISYFALISLFVYYVLDYISYKTKVNWTYAHICLAVCIIFAVGWCASIFNGMFFSIENGKFTHGQFYWFAQLGGVFVAFVTALVIFKYIKVLGIYDALFFLSFILLPLISIFIRLYASFFTMQMALTFSILLMFNFIHLTQVRQILSQQEEIKEGKISLSFSQIQPHFIFNTLNSIYVLCDKDNPELVKKAIGDFSSYLRTNIEVLENHSEILFEKEIENLKHYLNLEQLRFGDDVYVSYDLQETNFYLPPLTLQPIVENALKHGILKKENGGSIIIASYKTEDCYKIKISDDGVGFDTDEVFNNDDKKSERSHIGLKNVRSRLEIISSGTLEIKSKKGKGTCVFISIPIHKKRMMEEKNEYYRT